MRWRIIVRVSGMTRRVVVRLLLVLWALALGASLVVVSQMPAVGDGFTRGMNRLMTMVGFQIAAAVVGVAAFVLSRALPPSDPLRRLAWGPLALAIMLGISMIAPFVLAAL